jgi:hypothetical protein
MAESDNHTGTNVLMPPPLPDDELTVASTKTVPSSNKIAPVSIKFEFIIPATHNDAHSFTATKHHQTIISAIFKAFPDDIAIPSIDEVTQVKTFKQFPRTKNDYAKFFNHTKIVNKTTVRYVVAHSLLTSQRVYDIKSNPDVRKILKAQNCYIRFNMWPPHTLNIASIGWVSRISPQHYDRKTFENHLQSSINKYPKGTKGGAKIVVSPTSPTIASNNGHVLRTKAYEIQCKRSDYTSVLNALKWVYLSGELEHKLGMFVPFKQKYHEKGDRYRRAITQQNRYLAHSRVVPIGGIGLKAMYESELGMSSLMKSILASNLFETIQPTKHIDNIGKWNCITTSDQFEEARSWIDEHLVLSYQVLPEDVKLSFTDFPVPRVIRKPRRVDGASQTDTAAPSFGSTIAKSLETYNAEPHDNLPPTTVYTTYNEDAWNFTGLDDHEPPTYVKEQTTNQPTPTQSQASAAIPDPPKPSYAQAAAGTTPKATPTQTYDSENSKLHKKVANLEDRIEQLLQTIEAMKLTIPTPVTEPSQAASNKTGPEKRAKGANWETPESIRADKETSKTSTAARQIFEPTSEETKPMSDD